MKLNAKDVSTIVILNKSKQGTKTLQVKTKHLNWFKHYVVGISAMIACLICTIVFLNYRNSENELEKAKLMAQIVQLKGAAIPPPAAPIEKVDDPKEAQSYIQAIEGKLKKINDYLKKRGLKGFSTKAIGGDANASESKLTSKEIYMAYNEYLTNVVSSVGFTPMGYPRVSSFTSRFGYRNDPFNSEHAEYHPGIDFKGDRGDVVKSTANGRVIFAGWYGGYGNCVRIKHTNGYETLYGHLSRITVREGEKIAVGEKVGLVGSTGHSTGAHLHYEVRKNGKPVNPVKFLTLNN